MKTIRFHGWNARQAAKDGKKLTLVDRLIMLRSDLSHLEMEFVERGLSFSSTTSGKADGCRIMPIRYSNPQRWTTIEFIISDDFESLLWSICCDMSGIDVSGLVSIYNYWIEKEGKGNYGFYQGEGHIQYDKWGLASFCLERCDQWYINLIRGIVWGWTLAIKPASNKTWCSKGCLSAWNKAAESYCPNYRVHPSELDPADAVKELIKVGGKEVKE